MKQNELTTLLRDGHHSLVIKNDTGIYTFDGRGIADLYRLYTNDRETLRGACIADKIVGKAAAALISLGRAGHLYADIISKPALELLDGTDITVDYDKLTDHVINRMGTGWCPMEERCKDCCTPEECLEQIDSFINHKQKS